MILTKVFPHTAEEEITKVEIVRLYDMFDKFKIEEDLLVKIDVEGYEDRVIEGSYMILGLAKLLIIENVIPALIKKMC